MSELLRRFAAHPIISVELLLASLFANTLALASSIFVIQVLNRYVSYGVDATLATLTIGVVGAIFLEVCFRPTFDIRTSRSERQVAHKANLFTSTYHC